MESRIQYAVSHNLLQQVSNIQNVSHKPVKYISNKEQNLHQLPTIVTKPMYTVDVKHLSYINAKQMSPPLTQKR